MTSARQRTHHKEPIPDTLPAFDLTAPSSYLDLSPTCALSQQHPAAIRPAAPYPPHACPTRTPISPTLCSFQCPALPAPHPTHAWPSSHPTPPEPRPYSHPAPIHGSPLQHQPLPKPHSYPCPALPAPHATHGPLQQHLNITHTLILPAPRFYPCPAPPTPHS